MVASQAQPLAHIYLIPPTPTYLSLMRPQDLTENRINDHMDREFFPEKTAKGTPVQTWARAHPLGSSLIQGPQGQLPNRGTSWPGNQTIVNFCSSSWNIRRGDGFPMSSPQTLLLPSKLGKQEYGTPTNWSCPHALPHLPTLSMVQKS